MTEGAPLESDQPIILPPGVGPSHRTPYGDELVWKAGEAATGGRFSLHERTAPPGSRSVPHVHHHLVEAFYVLEGSCEFVVGDETVAAEAGTFVLVPRAVRHGWSVTGGERVSMLVFFTPSAKLAFFEEQQALLQSGGDAAEMRALAEKYDWT